MVTKVISMKKVLKQYNKGKGTKALARKFEISEEDMKYYLDLNKGK